MVENKGGLALKWVSPMFTGVPDRIVLMPGGRVYFVELKSATGVLSPRQRLVHGMLRALGMDVRVIDDLETLRTFIEIISHETTSENRK